MSSKLNIKFFLPPLSLPSFLYFFVPCLSSFFFCLFLFLLLFFFYQNSFLPSILHFFLPFFITTYTTICNSTHILEIQEIEQRCCIPYLWLLSTSEHYWLRRAPVWAQLGGNTPRTSWERTAWGRVARGVFSSCHSMLPSNTLLASCFLIFFFSLFLFFTHIYIFALNAMGLLFMLREYYEYSEWK